MFLYAVAVARAAYAQEVLDFGAIFGVWVAVSALHTGDEYWGWASLLVIAAEFVYPPLLAVGGGAAVLVHLLVTHHHMHTRHIGALVISVLSAWHYRKHLPWWQRRKG